MWSVQGEGTAPVTQSERLLLWPQVTQALGAGVREYHEGIRKECIVSYA